VYGELLHCSRDFLAKAMAPEDGEKPRLGVDRQAVKVRFWKE